MPSPRLRAAALSLILGATLATGAYALTTAAGAGDTGSEPAPLTTTVTTPAGDIPTAAELDALEASIDRRLAQARTTPAAPAPRVVKRYVRAPAAAGPARGYGDDDHGDDHGDDDRGGGEYDDD